MKKKVQSFWINRGIYDGECLVFVDTTPAEEALKEKDSNWKIHFQNLATRGFTDNFTDRTIGDVNGLLYLTLWLRRLEDTHEMYTLIAHEVLHIVQFTALDFHFDMIEEKEATAYLHSHLMKQILKKLK